MENQSYVDHCVTEATLQQPEPYFANRTMKIVQYVKSTSWLSLDFHEATFYDVFSVNTLNNKNKHKNIS